MTEIINTCLTLLNRRVLLSSFPPYISLYIFFLILINKKYVSVSKPIMKRIG